MFGNHGTDSAEATDNELLTEDCKKSLFATLKCIGVTFMATNQNDRILTIPFEQCPLRDILYGNDTCITARERQRVANF